MNDTTEIKDTKPEPTERTKWTWLQKQLARIHAEVQQARSEASDAGSSAHAVYGEIEEMKGKLDHIIELLESKDELD